MKLRTLVTGIAAACLTLAYLPAASAQDTQPSFGERGARGFGRGPGGEGFEGRRRPGFAGGRPGHGPRGPRGDGIYIGRIDSNDDGLIDADEFLSSRLARLERGFDRRDLNDDQLLTIDEAARERPPGARDIDRDAVTACVEESLPEFDPPEQLADIFDTVDTDNDSAVSLDELRAYEEAKALARFDSIDGNEDGYLDEDEIAAEHAQVRAVREVVRACVDGIADPFDSAPQL